MVRKRRLSDIFGGFFHLCHPVPVMFHCLAVTLFALLAAWPHLIWNTLLLVIAAHTAMQLSIAILNDYCDRHLDALSKRNKPIPHGLITPNEALMAGIFFIGIMFLLLLPLNPLALPISLLYLAFGLSYNLGLKSTPFSGIIFALAIPLIPLYAFVAVGRLLPIIFWILPIAALLGVALNLANSLCDIERDAANHAHTLAVVLGIRRSMVACSLLILLAALVIGYATLTHSIAVQLWLIVPLLGFVALASGVMLLFFGQETTVAVRKLYFYLVVVMCLLLAGGWLIGAMI